MDVNVHQPWSDIQSAHVGDRLGLRGRNILSHARDLAIRDCHIHDFADVVLRIDHVTALEEQVVAGPLGVQTDSGQNKKE